MTATVPFLLALAAAASPLAQANPTLPTRNAAGNDIVVTGSRSGDGNEVATLPASVTLIDADAIARRQTRIVSDVLRDVPGLAVNRTGGPGGLTQVRVRGSEANHVLVLIDGIEVSDPYQGEFDFGTLIADEAGRIEVLRGQQSSLYGSDAIGGVIHYITLTGREAPGVSLRAEGGAFGTFAGGARVAGYGDTIDYALSASLYRTEGTPGARGGMRDIGGTNVGATGKVTWTPSPVFRLTGVGRYSYSDSLANGTENDPASPRFGYTVDQPGTHFRNEGAYALARAELSLADGRWTTALSGQFAETVRAGFNARGRNSGNVGTRYKAALESSLRLGDAALSHRLTGAVDLEREAFRNTAPAGAFTGRRSVGNVGLVAQYELGAGDAFSAGASIRHDANNRFDDATTWRAQAGYRLPFGLRLRGAYGTGVKNPGFYDLYGYVDGLFIGNPGLRPEQSKGWEVGADQEIAGGKATIAATWFQARLEDEIFVTYPAPTYVATPSNRTTVSRQQGLELSVAARPIPQLRFDLTYTYLNARENGVEEVRRPNHIASLNTTVESRDQRFSATLTLRYNGRFTDLAYTDPSYVPVTVAMREFVLANLSAEYRLSNGLTLFGRVENFLDERYEELFSIPGTGRAAYAGVRARF